MPKLTVEGAGTFDVPQGKRMVLALEQDAGIDQLHACGGRCRCTTCRVEFVEGEPEKMTEAEKMKLAGASRIGTNPVAFTKAKPTHSPAFPEVRRKSVLFYLFPDWGQT